MASAPDSVIARLLQGNEQFAKAEWDPEEKELVALPKLKLAVVACMDTRYSVERVLGLRHGDAKVIRNAGNRLDDGTLRSLIVAVHLLEVKTIVVMGHTKCGMTLVGRGEYRIANSISQKTQVPLHEVMRPDFQRWLGGFPDVETNVREGIWLLRKHPYLPADTDLIGLVYDNDTGRIRQVKT